MPSVLQTLLYLHYSVCKTGRLQYSKAASKAKSWLLGKVPDANSARGFWLLQLSEGGPSTRGVNSQQAPPPVFIVWFAVAGSEQKEWLANRDLTVDSE